MVCVVGAFLLSDPILHTGTRSVTSGNRVADATLRSPGVLGASGTHVRDSHTQRTAQRVGGPRDWFLLLLFVPLFDLNPFSRLGTNSALDHCINTTLPGFLGGLASGVAVLAVPVLLLGIWVKLRQRSAKG